MKDNADAVLSMRVDIIEAAVVEMQDALRQASILPALHESSFPTVMIHPTPLMGVDPQPVISMVEVMQPAPNPVMAQAFCPQCGGGNPPGRVLCQWCGKPPAESLSTATSRKPERVTIAASVRSRKSKMLPSPKDTERPAQHTIPVAEQPTQRPPKPQFDLIKSSEYWLNKVGIVLFLFGVAFLFKYAVDKQWLTEQARLGAGIVLGSILLGFGLRLHAGRRHFSQVLMGGAVAAYYITGFAAYNIFTDLAIPYETVMGYMLGVTLLAFALSVWQHEASLSIVGAAGGLLTPFVLNSPTVTVPGLVTYTGLLLAGTSAVYMLRGWRSLLWTSAAGAWAVMLNTMWHGYINEGLPRYIGATNLPTDRLYLQAGIMVMLIAFWAVPVAQEVLWRRNPTRWERPNLDSLRDPELRKLGGLHAHIMAALVPAACLVFSWSVWSETVTRNVWGLVSLAGAVAMLGAFALVRRVDKNLAPIHTLMSVGLLTLGLTQMLEGGALLVSLAVEGAALLAIARMPSDGIPKLCGHGIFIAVASWLGMRLALDGGNLPAMYNPVALTDLAVIALAFGASFLLRSEEEGLAYKSAVHLAVMAWIWREVNGFPNGDGYVMLAWSGYGLMLHALSGRVRGQAHSLGTAIAGHFAFEAALGILAWRLATGFRGANPIFNEKAAIDLLFMGMALASSFVVRQPRIATVYRLVVHTAVLGWLLREATLQDLDSGYVMLRWAAYLSMLAFVSHHLRDHVTLRYINIPFAAVGALFAWSIMGGHVGLLAFLNAKTAIDVAVIAFAGSIQFVARPRRLAVAYRLAVHAGVLALLWRELSGLHAGADLVIFSWAAYAACLHIVARRIRSEETLLAAHAIFAGAGIWLAGLVSWGLLTRNEDQIAVLNVKGLADIGVIVLASVVCLGLRNRQLKLAYGLGMHVAFLGWMWQEFGLLGNGNGNGFVTIAWGVYAVALITAGLMLNRSKPLLYCGISLLFGVAAKMFLIDLRWLNTVWQILLFLGFGGFFLVVSYCFQRFVMERPDSHSSRETVSAGKESS